MKRILCKRMLCIWLPNWPVQRLVAAQPELKSKTIVLHRRNSRKGQQVAYCAQPVTSRRLPYVIEPGMSLAEVAALLRKNGLRKNGVSNDNTRSQLHFAEYDPRSDLDTLQEIAGWCEQFSPSLGLETADTPASLLLDVSSSAPRLGGEQHLVTWIDQAFQRRGYRVTMAVAETLGAAWAVAHFGSQVSDYDFRLPANSPGGHFVVPTGQALAALQPLPVAALRLGESTIDVLHQLGVGTIDHLLRLPRSGLKSRFGEQLLKRIDQALGNSPETFTAYRAPLPLSASYTFEHPTTRRQVVEDCIQQLLEPLCQRLREQDRGAIQILCTLAFMDQTVTTIRVGLYKPTFERAHLDELIRMQLDQRTIPDAVQRITLQIALAVCLEHRQHDLLGEATTIAPQQIAYLVDRLSCRLGRDTVRGARLRSEPQIERAFDYQPLTGQRYSPCSSTTAAVRHQSAAGLRPLFLTRPLRIHISHKTTSQQSNRPPESFGYEGRTYHIQHFAGPERIETGWWRGQFIRRDYYQVEDRQGNRFWVFQDLHQRAWFLHGLFG